MNRTEITAQMLLCRLDRIPVWPYPWSLLVVVGAGFFFSFFDIVTIAFALPKIITQFSVTPAQASWAVTSGLIGYIVGSLLDSLIADRYGRRISLFISVSLFTLGSALSATSPSLDWLIFWRFMSGMGIGAEIALVTTYMAEVTPASIRGRYTGWAIAAGFLGFATVPFVALLLVPAFSWGWRALFVAGALGGIVIIFMRRNLPSSPRWLIRNGHVDQAESIIGKAEQLAELRLGEKLPEPETGYRGEAPTEKNPGTLFISPYLGRVVLLMTVWFFYYVGNYAWLTLAPELLAQQGFKLKQDYLSLSISGFGFVAGAVLAIYCSDRFERKKFSAVIAMVWSLTLCMIGWFPTLRTVMFAGFIASLTIGMLIPVLYTYTGEIFPTRFRATAIALSDGIGHLGGAFCGQIVFAISAVYGFTGAFIGMGLSGLLAGLLMLFGPGTTKRSLDRI